MSLDSEIKQRIETGISCGLLLISLGTYYLLYFDAFFPITEGWFSTYAHLIRSGQLPYRDFFLLLPPLYPYQMAAFQTVFGESLINLRYLGLFVTCGIGLVLFEILRCVFRPMVAAFAACIALIYYQSGNAFLGYDFTQFLTLYLLLGTMFLVKYCSNAKTPAHNQSTVYLFVSGVFLGLAALTKQSNGAIGSAAVLLAAIIVISGDTAFNLTKRYLSLGAGYIGPFGVITIWLSYNRLWNDFGSNVFHGALQAKGGAHAVFLQWLAGFIEGGYIFHSLKLFQYSLFLILAIVSLSGLLDIIINLQSQGLSWRRWLSWDLIRPGYQPPILGRSTFALLSASFFLLLTIMWSLYHGIAIPRPINNLGALVRNQIILGATNVYMIGLPVAVWLFVRHKNSSASKYVIIFAFGVGLTVGNGTSGGLTEISAFLGLSLVVASLITVALPYVIPLLLPLSIFLSLTAVLVNEKYSAPYHWWAVTMSDIRTATCTYTNGILEGLCLDPRKKSKIDQIVAEVKRRTLQTDAIYIFPHTPIFHLLTGRPPYAKSPISWFDFMSDAQAGYVSDQLRTFPPALLVVSQLPELAYTTHERLFREGNNLGQREILRSIDTLEREHIIEKVKTVTDVDGLNIVIYANVQSDRKPSQP